MIRLQQQTVKPNDNRLRIVATQIINWLYANCFTDFSKIQQLRELNTTQPAKALKAAANEIADLLHNVITENKEI